MATKTNAKMENDKCNCDGRCNCVCCCGSWSIIGRILVILLLPFLLIWSLNTLFLTAIPMNPFTWFASLIIIVVLSGKAMKKMRFVGSCSCNQCKCGMMDQKK